LFGGAKPPKAPRGDGTVPGPNFFKFKILTPAQTLATIDATDIQRFCT